MSEPTVSISSCRETVTPLRVGLTPQPFFPRTRNREGYSIQKGLAILAPAPPSTYTTATSQHPVLCPGHRS